MTAFRESIAETLSTVSKAKARSATLWGRVEKLRAFVFRGIRQMGFNIPNILLRLFFYAFNLL